MHRVMGAQPKPSPGMAFVCRELAVTDIIYGGQLIAGSDVGQGADITTHDLGVVRPQFPCPRNGLQRRAGFGWLSIVARWQRALDARRGWVYGTEGALATQGLLGVLQEMSEADGFFRTLSPSARVFKAALPHYNPHGAGRTSR